ncbi:MAG: hypothetical protein ISN29_10035 [Gammaproteobacteria bacterium AqS3]|nr:hypothetical protein [Gammaproteobacteria bacterium AqS3]
MSKFVNGARLLAVSGLLLLLPSYASAKCSVEEVLKMSQQGMTQDAIKASCEKTRRSGRKMFSTQPVLLEDRGKPVREMLFNIPVYDYAEEGNNYMMFPGKTAKTRVDSSTPSFLVAVPEKVQPESYVFLIELDMKRNRREVSLGSGYYSLKTGIKRKFMVPSELVEVKKSARPAPKRHKLYRLTPKEALAPEKEYALVFAVRRGSAYVGNFYDFGVD